MASAGGGDEGRDTDRSPEEGEKDDLITPPGLTPWILKTRRDHPHLDRSFARLNAASWYNEEMRAEKRRRLKEEEKASQVAKNKAYWDDFYNIYPWNKFVPADPTSLDVLKGSIRLSPDALVTPVLCYPVISERQREPSCNVLVVLRTFDSETCYTCLCPLQYFPDGLYEKLSNQWKAFTDGWVDIECGSTSTVSRNGKQVNLISSGPLKNRTCDDTMLATINNGIIAARTSTKRKEYRANSLPFGKGREQSEVFVVEYLPWGPHAYSLLLTIPKSRQNENDVSTTVLELAMAAKHAKGSRHSTLGGALDKLCENATTATPVISAHDYYLNVALSGSLLLSREFGAIIPCKNQRGIYSATPCSCDVDLASCGADAKDRLRRIANGCSKNTSSTTQIHSSQVNKK